MRTTTSLLRVLLLAAGPFTAAVVVPQFASDHDADNSAANGGIPSADENAAEQIQIVGEDGAPLTLDKGVLLQLLELMKADKPNSEEGLPVQLSQNIFKQTVLPQRQQQQSLVYPWQALATSRERLVDHFRHGLDPGTATFIFLENHARSLVGLPWGEAGAIDAERILARLTHFVESLPSHSMLAIEGRYQHAVLRGLTYAPNVDAHSVFLEAEANHISNLMPAANNTSAASSTAKGLGHSVEEFSGLYTATEALDSLNGRLRWLFSLMQRRDDTLGLTLELCARFALSDSGEAIDNDDTTNVYNDSAGTNQSLTNERARIVAMAEALVTQFAARSRKHEVMRDRAHKKAKEKECIDDCVRQWPEKRSAQRHACLHDCIPSPQVDGNSTSHVGKHFKNVDTKLDGTSEGKKSFSTKSGGLLDHIDAKHVVRTMVRALKEGDAWVVSERRRIESIWRQTDTGSSADQVPVETAVEADQAALADRAKASTQAMGTYLSAAPGQLGRARALSFVLFALDRCRITIPDWSAVQPDKNWRFEWCHRHSVNQWAIGDSYVAGVEEPAYSFGQFAPSSSTDESIHGSNQDGDLGKSFDVASAVSMLADTGPGHPESLAYGRQRFVNGSANGCSGNNDMEAEASSSRRRASEVHLVCCSGLGGVRFPEGLALAQALHVRKVAESSAQPCRYRVDVCSPFACRNYAFSPWFDAVANPPTHHPQQKQPYSSRTAGGVKFEATDTQKSSGNTDDSLEDAITAVVTSTGEFSKAEEDLSTSDFGTYLEDAGVTSDSRGWSDVSHNLVDSLSPVIDLPTTSIVKSRETGEFSRCPHGSSCKNTSSSSRTSSSYCSSSNSSDKASSEESEGKARRLALRKRARGLVRVAYKDYMAHAYPMAELLPLTCRGGDFVLVNVSLVTLVDALDTLAVIGDAREFKHAVGLVVGHFTAPRTGGGGGRRKGVGGRGPFDFDVTVSVFETNIRLLGGLLSAHLLAEHPEWWDPRRGSTGGFGPQGEAYDGALLVRSCVIHCSKSL